MDTNKLKTFAQSARRKLLEQVRARLNYVLNRDTPELREKSSQVKNIKKEVDKLGENLFCRRIAYTWFNRFMALRFMDANNYTDVKVVSAIDGYTQPEILDDAKKGIIDEKLKLDRSYIARLLTGKINVSNPQNEAYKLLLLAVCHTYYELMPFMFEKLDDYTELLMPDDLLSEKSIISDFMQLSSKNIGEVESIGWMYQFYISEKKDEVFENLKKNRKINPENIPAATQLFTPHWIVKYMVENSLGRLWMLNNPDSKLKNHMEYFIEPEDVASGQGLVDSKKNRENYNDSEKLQRTDCVAESNGLDGTNLSGDQKLSERRDLRADITDSKSCSISSIEHSRRTGKELNSRIQKLPINSERISCGSRDPSVNCTSPELYKSGSSSMDYGNSLPNQQNAAGSNVKTSHQPLTTNHLRVSSPEEIRICDPACGSGHILVYAFDLLTKIYEECFYEKKDIPKLILEKNLHGIEIDARAGALAAFALTMKAREYDRRFFRRPVAPNICILQNIEFSDDEMSSYMDKVGEDLFTIDLRKTLLQFAEADNFGSLIIPALQNPKEAFENLKDRIPEDDLFLYQIHQKVLDVIKQADYLSQKYHCVIANPPYMGGKGMNPRLAKWAKDNYPDVKSDLFSAFIVRNFELSLKGGQLGIMSPFVWMFISSYEKLRNYILDNKTITSLVQLEYSGFDGATVPICTYTLENSYNPDFKGGYIKLSEFKGHRNQAPKTLEAINNHDCGWFFTASASDFKKIPGSPIAYGIPEMALVILDNCKLLNEVANPRKGMCTRDNDYFVRFWFELNINKLGFNFSSRAEAKTSTKKWFPYQKGGDFRQWYGNHLSVVDWEKDGFKLLHMKELGWHGNSTNHNLNYIFKPAIIWSKITSAIPDFRYSPKGFLFDDASGLCAVKDNDYIFILLSFLCSKVGRYYILAINPTLNIQPGNMAVLPILEKIKSNNFCSSLLNLSKKDWDNFETSWDFTKLPLLKVASGQWLVASKIKEVATGQWPVDSNEGKLDTSHYPLNTTLSDAYNQYFDYYQNMTMQMKELEEENNRIFIEAYGLQDELTPDVPLKEITLTGNPYYRYSVDAESDRVASDQGLVNSEEKNLATNHYPLNTELKERFRADTMKEFISYAVGCMFGRYSLDKPGLILANQGETVADYISKVASGQCLVTSAEGTGEVHSVQGLVVSNYAENNNGDSDSDKMLQRSNSMAESDGFSGDGLSGNQAISERGDIRTDQSDSKSCGIDTIEHSRRTGSEFNSGIQKFPINSKGFSGGTGNAITDNSSLKLSVEGTNAPVNEYSSGNKQNDSSLNVKTSHWPLSTSHLSFMPDEDNVIPVLDSEWFSDDIVERFKKFLKVTFGQQHFEENLNFIENAIGKDIRKYFVKDFYADHIKRYKKRPIYWMFSSPKKYFNALIYMHRYKPDTVSVILNDYLREYQNKLNSHKEHLNRMTISESISDKDKRKAQKELDNTVKIIKDLEDYEKNTIYPLATEKIEIDLDDGVKVNYKKFGKALAKVTGLS